MDATNDAAFCGPDFTGAIDRLAVSLPDQNTPEAVGLAGTAVVVGHDAGCANRTWIHYPAIGADLLLKMHKDNYGK